MSQRILICGASFAGLATAFWMQQLGHQVTVVEKSGSLKRGGTPVNIRDRTLEIVRRMGLLDKIQAHALHMDESEWQAEPRAPDSDPESSADLEIERDVLLCLLFDAVQDKVEFVFGDCVKSLQQQPSEVEVWFQGGTRRSFELVLGCDGVRSGLRSLCFGPEESFTHFMKAYGSVTILDWMLVPDKASQLHKEPGKAVVLNGYNGKTDIILMFFSETEIDYDHRDKAQKRAILLSRFASVPWRGQDWLRAVEQAEHVYFDKLCQIRMPTWSHGRVALVGDAAYCASPAAGRGGSLALDGAAALAEAFRACPEDYRGAFVHYEQSFRPFIEQVQAEARQFCSDFLQS